MLKCGYTGECEITYEYTVEKISVNLIGKSNKCEVICFRLDVQFKNSEKWQKNLLPPCQLGFLVLTSVGIMDQNDVI
jgi:small subunit ribosomal protein S15Ae